MALLEKRCSLDGEWFHQFKVVLLEIFFERFEMEFLQTIERFFDGTFFLSLCQLIVTLILVSYLNYESL